MGVEGVQPLGRRPADAKRAADVKCAADADADAAAAAVTLAGRLATATITVPHEQDDADDADQHDTDDENSRTTRRSSLPSTFADPPAAGDARRWRSFDAALLLSGRDVDSHDDGASARDMAALARRIDAETAGVSRRKARLGRRRELLRSVGAAFSSARRAQVQLLQMQLAAELARGARSVEVLTDIRTLVLALEAEDPHEDNQSEDESASTASIVSSASTRGRGESFCAGDQRLLESLRDADKALREDCLHHALALQAQFLQQLAAMHARREPPATRAPSLQHFLNEFTRADGAFLVPGGLDAPTAALVRFEKLVTRQRLLPASLKRALDALCVDSLRALTLPAAKRQTVTELGAAAVFAEREPRDVMLALVRELEDAVAREGRVTDAFRPLLRAFVEQMVFARLASACYRGNSTDLDELNAAWREHAQLAHTRGLGLHEVGLARELLPANPERCDVDALFAGAIAQFNRLPHLVPACILAQLLAAVRELYREAAAALSIDESAVSADVLLPLLVLVLSRAELPHLHSQVFLMEQYAVDAAQDGSEAAYYLACLQAAMGYLQGGCPDDEGAK